MKSWHALFELLAFPIALVFMGTVMIGLGNLFTNPSYQLVTIINNDYVSMIAEIFSRTGQFIVVNFPFLFLIRLASRKSASVTTVLSAIAGYIMFLVATIFFAPSNLSSNAYTSTLGLSISKSSIYALSNGTHYPLQTGIFGMVIVMFITLISFRRGRKHSEYGVFSFVSKEMICVIRTMVYSLLAGIAFSFVWPYALAFINRIITFISVDTSNPINMAIYGIMDRLLSLNNLGTLIRQPFWYGASGGSWLDLGGNAITGDVNIWSQQIAAGSVNGMIGHFITPYYILNIFAIPGLIWAMYSLETGLIEKRKMRLLCILGTVSSLLFGNILPFEMILVFLCPLLFFIHLAYTGFLYALLQGLHIYLGFNTTDSLTITAMPGSLSELITYISMPSLQRNILIIVMIGIIFALLYFFTTRIYFRYLALDIFRTDAKERIVKQTIEALGGIENIKITESSVAQLRVTLYDPEKLDSNTLRQIGAFRILETKTGFVIYFGAYSTIIHMGIDASRRSEIRQVED